MSVDHPVHAEPASAPLPLIIRDTVAEDIEAISAIYAIEVLQAPYSFEVTPPDAAEMANRIAALRAAGYPHRVAVLGGEAVGYAYAGAYRPRAAYRFTVENSIYVHRAHQGKGIGSRLLADLIGQCQAQGFREIIAVIGDRNNRASIALHHRAGFRIAGILNSIGHKFDRWIDVVLMQKSLSGSIKSDRSSYACHLLANAIQYEILNKDRP